MTESLQWLASFPELRALQDESWVDAIRAARKIALPAGSMVVHKGDPCREFLLVAQGRLRVFERTKCGREITLFRTGPGEVCILTLQGVMQGTDYAAEAVTEEEVCVIAIPMPAFDVALACSPGFRRFVLSSVGRHLGDVMQLVEQIAFQNLDVRLACLLGQLAAPGGSIRITHERLASELGSTREVVSRALEKLERRGCVRLQRGVIQVMSHDVLRRIMQQA